MGELRVAVHLHTSHSPDSNIDPVWLVEAARAERLDCIAVTDHDAIDGALAARATGGIRVIVGEEVSSRDGHIIGLFLEEWIPPGLSAGETVDRIHEQGGLALAPHPFSRVADHSLGDALWNILPRLDAIEVHNAQNWFVWEDARAERVAREHGMPGLAGSDTHIRGRVAPAWQTMPDFDGPKEFLAALRSAQLVRGRFGLGYASQMMFRHVWQRILGLPLAGYGENSQPRPARSPEGGHARPSAHTTHG